MADKGSYETFDSADGPVNKKAKGEMTHMDSAEGLNGYCSNAVDDEQGSVPEVPSKKR
jgi:hypothetical protein